MVNFTFAEDITSGVTKEEAAALAELGSGKLVLEVGSWRGRSTVALASVAAMVHSVDWHKGDAHSSFGDTLGALTSNLKRYQVQSRVVLHVGRNEDILPVLAAHSFDLIFIDSFHAKEAVERDLILSQPLVKPGGVIACHDYGHSYVSGGVSFGVTEAVEAFIRKESLSKSLVQTLAIIRMP